MSEVQEKLKQMSDFRSLVLTSIISALALVVGLFWNDAVRSAIEKIIPSGDSVLYKFVAAIVATIIVVMIIYMILYTQKLREKRLKKKDA